MATGWFDLVALAIFLVVLYRLISVLGSKTGNERPPFTHRDAESDGNVITLPGTRREEAAQADVPVKTAFDKLAPAGSALAKALTDIRDADSQFEPDHFLSGCRAAYEIIVTAFAAGDRKSLKPLISSDVYKSFDGAITERESQGKSLESNFVGVEKAEIVDAALKQKIAEVTVKFVSEVISVTKNADGAVIEGDPTTVRKITDIWTFARDTRSSNPNWKLVGTASGT